MTASATAYKIRKEIELEKEKERLAKQKHATYLAELELELLHPTIAQKRLQDLESARLQDEQTFREWSRRE